MLPFHDIPLTIQDSVEMSSNRGSYLAASVVSTSPDQPRHRQPTPSPRTSPPPPARSTPTQDNAHHDHANHDYAPATPDALMDTSKSRDEYDRGTWANPTEFVLSCLGYAVGLGNVWRFPYLCYQNGGGAFLIPYVIMLCFVGLPVFFIELSVGQYSSSGPMTLWSVSPIFQGIGAGMIVVSFMVNIYYNMIIGWSIYYTYASFKSPLPWSTCNHTYNTMYCYSKSDANYCENMMNGTYINRQCYQSNETLNNLPAYADCQNNCTSLYQFQSFDQGVSVIDSSLSHYVAHRTGASEEYFNYGMLAKSDDMNDAGSIQGHLVGVLAIAWIICFLCVIKGIRSSGKVVYVTATFPYLVLFVLFLRGVTLPGAGKGVAFYIIPDWSKLLTSKVWGDAAGQIFFSLGCSMGGLMTFASYNKFNNNIYRDTLIVSIGNCLTSFFAGFVIFSILGFMAHERGTEVAEVVKSGSALAFIAYPEVVSQMPLPTLWSVLFFMMLITLGLDSQFASVECVLTAIQDCVPKLRKYKSSVSLALCFVTFLIGLIMCTQSGIYWLEIMSYYAVGWSLVFIGLAEVIVFAWIYGAGRLCADIEEMTGIKLKYHWVICWRYITPILLTIILLLNFIRFTPLSVGGYTLPSWAQAIGWLMALTPMAVIVGVASFKLFYSATAHPTLSFLQRVRKLSQPLPSWKKCNREKFTLSHTHHSNDSNPIYTLSTVRNVYMSNILNESNDASESQFDV